MGVAASASSPEGKLVGRGDNFKDSGGLTCELAYNSISGYNRAGTISCVDIGQSVGGSVAAGQVTSLRTGVESIPARSRLQQQIGNSLPSTCCVALRCISAPAADAKVARRAPGARARTPRERMATQSSGRIGCTHQFNRHCPLQSSGECLARSAAGRCDRDRAITLKKRAQ